MKTFTGIEAMLIAIAFVLAVMFFHQAWENIVNQRVSKFSLDALFVTLGLRFGTHAMRKRIRNVIRSPARMRWAGMYALALALTSLALMVIWLGLL